MRRSEIPAGKVVHAILDNYAAHKTPEVRRWLERHPRWTFHFTPTSSSWLNFVEGFFAKLSRRRLKHGVFCSVPESADDHRATQLHHVPGRHPSGSPKWFSSARLLRALEDANGIALASIVVPTQSSAFAVRVYAFPPVSEPVG